MPWSQSESLAWSSYHCLHPLQNTGVRFYFRVTQSPRKYLHESIGFAGFAVSEIEIDSDTTASIHHPLPHPISSQAAFTPLQQTGYQIIL